MSNGDYELSEKVVREYYELKQEILNVVGSQEKADTLWQHYCLKFGIKEYGYENPEARLRAKIEFIRKMFEEDLKMWTWYQIE